MISDVLEKETHEANITKVYNAVGINVQNLNRTVTALCYKTPTLTLAMY